MFDLISCPPVSGRKVADCCACMLTSWGELAVAEMELYREGEEECFARLRIWTAERCFPFCIRKKNARFSHHEAGPRVVERKRRRRSLSGCENARDMHIAKRRWNEALRSSASPISLLSCVRGPKSHTRSLAAAALILPLLKAFLLSSVSLGVLD
jgi:hypothetical protein